MVYLDVPSGKGYTYRREFVVQVVSGILRRDGPVTGVVDGVVGAVDSVADPVVSAVEGALDPVRPDHYCHYFNTLINFVSC